MSDGNKGNQPNMKTDNFPHATEAIMNHDVWEQPWLGQPANTFLLLNPKRMFCFFLCLLIYIKLPKCVSAGNNSLFWYSRCRCSLTQIYRSFGLGSSYAKVMKFGCLLQYSEYGAVERDFPDVPHRLLKDIYQVQMNDTANTSTWHWGGADAVAWITQVNQGNTECAEMQGHLCGESF